MFMFICSLDLIQRAVKLCQAQALLLNVVHLCLPAKVQPVLLLVGEYVINLILLTLVI